VSALDRDGQTIWIVDVHHGDGKRLVLRADEKLTAFVELESAIRAFRRPLSCLRRILTLGRAWFDLYVRSK
jgi:hypothetical protein